MKNASRSDKAITLVALVVVIVVLLILAGVSLGMAVSNNGTINKAKESSNIYSKAEEEESETLNELSDEVINQENDKNRLVSQFKDGIIKVGDYISYNTPSNGTFTTSAYGDNTSNGFANQTYDVNNNGIKINWRVLGLGDENGNLTLNYNKGTRLLLIAGSPVQKVINNSSENEYDKNPYLYMGKAEGYVNAKNILDGISSIYLNPLYGDKARSICINDINTLLEVEVNYESGKVYRINDNTTNIDMMRSMGNEYSFNENDYTASSFLNSRKTAINNGETKEIGKGYSYGIESFRTKNVGNTTIGNLIFRQTDYGSRFAKSYWLSSNNIEVNRSAAYCIGQVYFDSVNMADGKFYSNGNWYVFGLGVYPIISLKPSITIDQLHVLTESESDWNYINNTYYAGNVENYNTIGQKKTMF